jgi:hypothetical protein
MSRPIYKELPKFSTEDCDKGEVIKPFFSESIAIFGLEDKTRIFFKVPNRHEKGIYEKEITIHRGERTYVESGEICLTNGSAIVIKEDGTEQEEVDIKPGMTILSGTKMSLNDDEEVSLELADGYQTTVNSHETYKFDLIYSDKLDNNWWQNFPSISDNSIFKNNYKYGFLYEGRKSGASHILPHLYLKK